MTDFESTQREEGQREREKGEISDNWRTQGGVVRQKRVNRKGE